MATYRNRNQNRKFYRINQYITASEIRLIDEDSKQIGVIPLAQARTLSQENGLDLVEIAPLAKPPVVKMINFAKFRYQEAKKLKAEKRGLRGGETKEIQATPFISANDYETALNKAKKFLATGNKVKLSIKFQGRQILHPEFGHNLIHRFGQDLADISTLEGEAKLIGKRLLTTLTPHKKNEKAQPQTKN